MTTTETTLLTWKEGQYSTEGGHAGGIKLFSITWKTLRADPDWKMDTELPGYYSKRWKSNNLDELKAIAEKVLAEWLARVSGGEPS